MRPELAVYLYWCASSLPTLYCILYTVYIYWPHSSLYTVYCTLNTVYLYFILARHLTPHVQACRLTFPEATVTCMLYALYFIRYALP